MMITGNHTIPKVGPEYDNGDSPNSNTTIIRTRRSIDNDQQQSMSADSADDKPTLRRTPHEIIRCNKPGFRIKKPICAEVVCTLPELSKGRAARVEVQGWLFSKTYFKEHISDVEIFTDISCDIGQVPDSVIVVEQKTAISQRESYISQTFHFPNVKPRKLSQLPIWPIILGVILGVLLLTVIIVSLYKCGFFRRRINRLKQTPTPKKKGPVILHPGDPRPNDNAALL